MSRMGGKGSGLIGPSRQSSPCPKRWLPEGASPFGTGLERDTDQVQMAEPVIETPGVLIEEGHGEGLSEVRAQVERAARGPVVVAQIRPGPRPEGLQLQLADEEGRPEPEEGGPAVIENDAVAVARGGDEDVARIEGEVLVAAQGLHEADPGLQAQGDGAGVLGALAPLVGEGAERYAPHLEQPIG